MSNVKVKDRKETDVFFLIELLNLIGENGAILAKRKKDRYYVTYAEHMIKMSLISYENAQIANSIMISRTTPAEDYNRRRKYFQLTLANVNSYQSVMLAYITTCLQLNTINSSKAEKFMERQGLRIANIKRSIVNVMKRDAEKYRNLEKERIKKAAENEVYYRMEAEKKYYTNIYKQRENRIEKPMSFQPISFEDENESINK